MPCSTARSDTPVRSTTRPPGVTIAENPVGAACSTQRPVSIARSWLDATCWPCTWVPVKLEPFVGLRSTAPPLPMASRARSGKNTSQLITTPKSPAGVDRTASPSPGMASRPGSVFGAKGSMSERSGTNSPNGTRRSLSTSSTTSPSGPSA